MLSLSNVLFGLVIEEGCVRDATPGIGPEKRERLSLIEKLPRRRSSSASSSPDNKNKSSPTWNFLSVAVVVDGGF